MTNIYDVVVSLIGTLPTNLEFIYGILTLLLSVIIVMLPFVPFIIIWKLVK